VAREGSQIAAKSQPKRWSLAMPTIRHILVTLAAALSCCAFSAQAAEMVFVAKMDGAQNLPEPIKTPATGEAILKVSADGKKVAYKVTVDKLTNIGSADLHLGGESQNGPLVVKLWPHGVAPKKGEFSGVLAEGTIEPGDFLGSMAGSPMSDLIEELKAGMVYVNVHTNDGQDPPNSGPGDYRLGEIRGQMKPQ
jgi:hypothetical protein